MAGSRSTKNRDSGFLLILYNILVNWRTSNKRSSSSDLINSVDGLRFRMTTRYGLSSLSWCVWYSVFGSLRKWISVLYEAGWAVIIFRRSVEDLQNKLYTKISSKNSLQRSVKLITLLTIIRGGRVKLIPTLMVSSGFNSGEISGIAFESEEVTGSSCESTLKLLVVKNNFSLYCIFSEFRSEENDEWFLLHLFFVVAGVQLPDGEVDPC